MTGTGLWAAGPGTRVCSGGFEPALVDFLFGRPLGPQTTTPASCGTDTRRPNTLFPQVDQ
jgi:hypothetical protein